MGHDWKIVGDAEYLNSAISDSNKKSTEKHYRSYFSSPEAFAREIATVNPKDCWHRSAWDRGNESWNGTNTMADALNLAVDGWPEGVAKATRLIDRIKATNPLQLKQIKYSIAGAYPNIPRAIAGNHLNMRVPDIARASRRPVITLMSNMSANCGHSGEEITNRASVVAALVDVIESAGYACDVIAYGATASSCWSSDPGVKLDVISTVQVKNSNQPMDINRIAFGLGHASMFRRLMFADWERDSFCKELGASLGGVCDYSKDTKDKNVYFLPSVENAEGHFDTEKDAATKGLQFLVDSLRKQGFPLFMNEDIKIAA